MDTDETKLNGEDQTPIDEAAAALADAEREAGQAVGSDSMQKDAMGHTADHGSIKDNAEAAADQAGHEVKELIDGE